MSKPARHLAVFAHERTDARVGKRIRALMDLGWTVTAFTFHRPRPGRDQDVAFANVDLGETRDRAYARRALSLLRATRLLWHERATLRTARALYAINTDNALLALAARLVAGRPLPLFLEIADLQPPFLDPGGTGRLLRWIERRVLARTHCLVTTAPGFLHGYFAPWQHYAGRVFLLENKVYPSSGLLNRSADSGPPGPPWRIGWFGALRCQASWEAIQALARRHPDSLQFVIRGYPTTIDPATFFAQVGKLPNIKFGGTYRYPDELPDLHRDLHFAWGIDFSDPAANSRWLLPNRLYESGLFHVPLLAAAGTETGRRVASDGTGPALAVDVGSLADGLSAFFTNLTPEMWMAWRGALESRPSEAYAGEADYARLSAAIDAATP